MNSAITERFIPREVEIFGVYAPPLLLAVTLGVVAMLLTVYFLNRHRMSRYFYLPELVMLALIAIYTAIIGTFVIPT
jgi:uncharacterized membrane protein YidH (DUF202 family)